MFKLFFSFISLFTGDDNKNFSSPSFFFAGALWHLRIYPNGHRIYNSVGYVGLFLWRKSPGNAISLDYSFGVKTLDGKKVREKHLTSVFREAGKGYGNAKCLSRSELQERESELISSEGFTVFFTLKCSESTEDASKSNSPCKKVLDIRRKDQKSVSFRGLHGLEPVLGAGIRLIFFLDSTQAQA